MDIATANQLEYNEKEEEKSYVDTQSNSFNYFWCYQ